MKGAGFSRSVARPCLAFAAALLCGPARAVELDGENARFLSQMLAEERSSIAPEPRQAGPVDAARVRGWVERGPGAVPDLVRTLDSSEDVGERSDAVEALVALGQDAVPPLLQALTDRQSPSRTVSRALASMGPAAVPALLDGLPARPPRLRQEIAAVLGESRPVLAESIKALERLAASDPDLHARLDALRAIARIGPEAQVAAPTLTVLLDDRVFSLYAAQALAAVGGDPRRAADVLIKELRRPGEGWGQAAVVRSLGLTAAQVPEALDALVEALRCSPFIEVRAGSARALGLLGPAARAAVIPLIMASDDEGRDSETDLEVRKESRAALERIGDPGPGAVADLIVLLGHRESWARVNAAEALGRVGPPASAAVPALAARIHEEGGWGGAWAEAIGSIGQAGPEVVAILEKATLVREPGLWNVPQASAFALTDLGMGREAALAYFRRQFNSRLRSDEFKIPSAEGLRRLGEEESRVLRFLTDVVRATGASGDKPWVAQRATDILARYGAKADPAVPAIERWLAIGSDWYRASGLAALRAIDTPAARAALAKFGPGEEPEAPPPAPAPLPRLREPTRVERLIFSLRNSPATEVRVRSARELGHLGKEARPALYALLFAAGDLPAVSEASAEALERIGAPEPEAVGGLWRFLYGEPGTGVEAAKALGRIGPAAKDAVQTLSNRASWSAGKVACPAADALARIGADTPEALKALKEGLEFKSYGHKDLPGCAARALLALGRERDLVRSHYAGLLAFDAFLVKLEGVEGLIRLGEADAACTAALTDAIASAETTTALKAVELMGLAGPRGDPAVPALERRLGREKTLFTPSVAQALRSVGTTRALVLLGRYGP